MLSTLALIMAVTNLSTLLGVFGYKKRAKTLKKVNENLKAENGQLLEAVAEALSDHVTDGHVREYLKAVDQAGHKWKLLSTQEFNWGGKGDELATYRCERCTAVHRVWGRGHGAVDRPEAQGIWIDGLKLTTEDNRRHQCAAIVTKNVETEFTMEKASWPKLKEKAAAAKSLLLTSGPEK